MEFAFFPKNKDKIGAGMTAVLCIGAQILLIYQFVMGFAVVGRKETSFLYAYNSIFKILHITDFKNILEIILGVAYFVILFVMARKLLLSILDLPVGEIAKKSENGYINCGRKILRGLGGTFFCSWFHIFLASIGVDAETSKDGNTVLGIALFVFLLSYVLLFIGEKKRLNMKFLLISVVRYGMLFWLLYQIFVLFLAPCGYNLLINNLLLISSLISDSNIFGNFVFGGGFLVSATDIFRLVILGSATRALYHATRPFDIYAQPVEPNNFMKHCFKRIMWTSGIWAVCKYIIPLYWLSEEISGLTWGFISRQWFDSIKTDLFPGFLLAFAGYVLFSVSYSSPYSKKIEVLESPKTSDGQNIM